MKAYIYELEIFDNVIDKVHNMGRLITEVYVPEMHICFNNENGIFSTDKIRNEKSTEIEVDKGVINLIEYYLNFKSAVIEKTQIIIKNNIDKLK